MSKRAIAAASGNVTSTPMPPPKVSPANVDHWLFQHSWVVTGARFGWWQGAEALRLLVRVDERAQKLWGVGTRSAQLARRALAEVEARGA